VQALFRKRGILRARLRRVCTRSVCLRHGSIRRVASRVDGAAADATGPAKPQLSRVAVLIGASPSRRGQLRSWCGDGIPPR
jgi:hypothetical protein